ncbi:MAG TPA: hypothetical protein VG917_01365 [Patescibacteria group bacterium]|nr:hypothetical protein [Patescibacteria group bacterium]
MKEDINLVIKTNTDKKIKDKVFLGTLVVFLILFALGAIVLIYSITLTSKASALANNANDLRSKISSYSDQKTKLLTISERLVTIRKIINTRKKIDEEVSGIVSYVPDNLAIDSIYADDTKVTMGFTSPQLSDFDTLLESKIPLMTKDKSLNISRVAIGSFSQKSTGYLVLIDFIFRTAPVRK